MDNPLIDIPSDGLYNLTRLAISFLLLVASLLSPQDQPLISSIQESYDYVIIGGGTAGSVLASRLSEDPSVSVLVMEAGVPGNFLTRTPILAYFLAGSQYDWGYTSTPQRKSCFYLNNRQLPLYAGKALGGSSMVNLVMWVRGIKSDFDNWLRLGASGWSYEENLPYFIRSENVQISRFQSPLRGVNGPITINEGNFEDDIEGGMIAAGAYLGYRTDYDYNGHSRLGFSRVQSDVSLYERVDSDRGYLEPIRNIRSNLDILTSSMATRILLTEQRRAYGVEFYETGATSTQPQRIYARREVIVSAGAFGSPKLLMLSGIGPTDHLRTFDIPVYQDLPVGNNLMDHVASYGLLYETNQPLTQTLIEGFLRNDSRLTGLTVGPAALIDFTGFINTKTGPNDPYDTPNIQFIGAGGETIIADLGLFIRHSINVNDGVWDETFGQHLSSMLTASQYPSILLHPKSRGTVRLASSDPFVLPLIDTNYLDHPDDLMTLVESLKIQAKLFESPPMRKFAPRFVNISLPGCPYPPDPQSDGWLACFVIGFTRNIYHYMGTCRMGHPSDPNAVVDPMLRVIGVKGLRVVDATVFPSAVSGNPQATVYMLAEKAADMIKGNSLSYPQVTK